GSLGDAPVLFESLDVEKPQRREAVIHGTRRQLLLLKQLSLVLTNVPQAQTVRRTVEASSKIFDCADVVACGMLRVITTLEFRRSNGLCGNNSKRPDRSITSALPTSHQEPCFPLSPFLNPDIRDAEARLAGTCLQQDRGS